MDNCPYCGAPGAAREAVDGSCYVCGMVLSDPTGSIAPSEPAATDAPPAEAVESQSAGTIAHQPAPGPSSATIEYDLQEVPPIQLVQPRNLSPEYARRVTAAWQATKSPFQNPRETLNSSSTKTGDPTNLVIGTRSLGSVDDKERADFELREVIGEGNMGTVWSARQASLDRDVAVKMPKHTPGGSTIGREQFISEVVVTGQLDHPNIVPIYDLGRDEAGQLFYAMKRIEGQPWDKVMHEPGRTRQDNVEVLMKVCDAIRFAHDRGVIHRDIKPQNIMVGKYGEVSVMDWGIALRLDTMTGSSNIVKLSPAGTPAYMAPEMATANAADIGPHTDVYLLGACLYETITGEPPHPPPADSHDRFVQQNACLLVAARNLITPAKESGELIDIAYKAMATDISKRYQTVDEFQSAIREYFSHAESIALSERGQEHLSNALAMRNGVYEDYAKARFAFSEAIDLWPENAKARSGLNEATLAYAGSALERGDYALGLSLLDRNRPEHVELWKKLSAAKRKADRNRFMAMASATAAACCLTLGLVGVSYFGVREYRAKLVAQEQREEAQRQEREATRQRGIAEVEKVRADQQRELAVQAQLAAEAAQKEEALQKQNALTARDAEAAARQTAEQARIAEERERLRAEQASYQSEIGLASEQVQRNAFAAARDILGKQLENKTQSGLRNWEWGHLAYLATQPSIEQFEIESFPRVESVALSPDQKWVAAGADDGNVHVWWRPRPQMDPIVVPGTSGQQSAPIVAISSDNRLLAVAAGNEVRFYELPAAEPGRELKQAGQPLRYSSELVSLALSPNAELVLTSSRDSTAQLWSRSQPGQPRVFTGHLTGPVWQARFSPSGQQIVTAGADESVRIWDANSGAEVRRLDGHRGPVYAADFSPDGSYVASGGEDRRLLAWNVQSSDEAVPPSDVIRARLKTETEPDAGNGDFQVLGEHGAAIRAISFAPKGAALYSASQDNTVCMWDISKGPAAAQLTKSLRGHGGWVRSCAASDDGHVLSGAYDGRVFLWDTESYAFPRVLRSVATRSLADLRLTSVSASPDARWIATAAQNGIVTVWDMQQPLNPVPHVLTEGHDWQATTAAYFGGGSRLVTSGGDNSTVVWDTKLGNQLLKIGGAKAPAGTGWRGVAAASHHGKLIATGSWKAGNPTGDKTIANVWDANTGRLVLSLARPHADGAVNGEPPEATAMAFSPDDQIVFVGDQWGQCALYRTNDGQLLKAFAGHKTKINAAGFLPNGHLLTASSDRTVAKWNVAEVDEATPRPGLTLPHSGRILAMDISADGARVVTASDANNDDAVLRLWNPETGEETYRLTYEELSRVLNITAAEDEDPIVVRSVSLHPSEPHALVTVFDPNKIYDPNRAQSPYQVGRWNWQNTATAFVPQMTRLDDTSLAVYAQDRPGAILTVGGRGARVRLANQSNEVVMSYRPQTGVQSVSFSSDGKLLAAAGIDGSLKLWRFDDATSKWSPDRKLMGQHRGPVSSVTFHPEQSTMMLSAGADGTARLWERAADDWKVAATFGGDGEKDALNQAIFAPADGNPAAQVITASDDGRVRVWTLDGQPIGEPLQHEGPVRCVAVSPDGKWIVSSVGIDALAWSRESPQSKPIKLAGHWADITSIQFSPDGQRIISTARDFNVKLWDSGALQASAPDAPQQSVRELLTLEGHSDGVMGIAFFASPTFPSIVSAGEDGQVILWPSLSWQGTGPQALGRR